MHPEIRLGGGDAGRSAITQVFDADVAGLLPLPGLAFQLDLLDFGVFEDCAKPAFMDQGFTKLDVEFAIAAEFTLISLVFVATNAGLFAPGTATARSVCIGSWRRASVGGKAVARLRA